MRHAGVTTGIVNAADRQAKNTTVTQFEPATHKHQRVHQYPSTKGLRGAVTVRSRGESMSENKTCCGTDLTISCLATGRLDTLQPSHHLVYVGNY